MAGRIPREFIDQLLQRIDIVDIIGTRVSLRKAGKDFQACCPFHDEKTPSFTVSQDKQFYHCFGCGAHGSALGFLMDYDRMPFPEAVEELARRAGVEVPREFADPGPEQDLRPLYQAHELAAQYYQLQLRQHPQSRRAVDYLKQRGLSGKVAAEFGLGFAPTGWDNLLNALTQQGFSPSLLLQAGLISEPEPGKRYDRLRDRIVFPIRDPRGRVIAFGGRQLPDGDNAGAPKYLNSPETPIFHKGRHLYGLYELRQALRRPERLLVVEGYMDVVALAQHGVHYAVATLGTATTPDHLELLFRQCPELIFCFDGDRAGREAGWKALKVALPHLSQGREIRFLFLPEGDDPDSLIRKEGAVAFEQRLVQALPLSDYLFGQLALQLDLGSDDGRARFAAMATPYLKQLPDGLFKQMLWRRLAKETGATLAELDPHAARDYRKQPPSNQIGRPPAHQHRPTPLRQAVILLLRQPQLALRNNLPEDWSNAQTDGIDLLRELVALIRSRPEISLGQLVEHWRDSDLHLALLKLSAAHLNIPEEGYAAEFRGCLGKLAQQAVQQEFDRLTRLTGQRPLNKDELERLKALTKMIAT